MTIGAISIATIAVFQIRKVKMTEIIPVSSIFNIGWGILAIPLRVSILLAFLAFYSISSVIVIFIIKINFFYENKTIDKTQADTTTVLLALMNLAGIPPSLGFLNKLIISVELISIKMLLVATSSLVASTISLFIYLRIIAPNLFKENRNKLKESNNNFLFFATFNFSVDEVKRSKQALIVIKIKILYKKLLPELLLCYDLSIL